MSRIFRPYLYTWWQMGLFKITLLAIGVVLGAAFADVVMGVLWWLMALWIIPAAYLVWVTLKPGSPTRLQAPRQE